MLLDMRGDPEWCRPTPVGGAGWTAAARWVPRVSLDGTNDSFHFKSFAAGSHLDHVLFQLISFDTLFAVMH
jgi:hypothetical protein